MFINNDQPVFQGLGIQEKEREFNERTERYIW